MKDFRSYKPTNTITNSNVHKPTVDAHGIVYNNLSQTQIATYNKTLFFCDVYKWMFISLTTIVFSGFLLSYTNLIDKITQGEKNYIFPLLLIIFFILQLFIIYYFNKYAATFSTVKAKITFMLFFLLYTPLSGFIIQYQSQYQSLTMIQAFISVAGTYAVMAIFVTIIKKPIQGKLSILFMIIIGLIIASVLNMFMCKTHKDFLTSLVLIFMFAFLTLYSQKRLLTLYDDVQELKCSRENFAMLGVLSIYYNILTLFIFITSFVSLSKRKKNKNMPSLFI